ncbi:MULTISPECIES: phosphopantetheine-binding protein [unclassified Streptomyces]|uniref:acyl carrier protein n=1 Tax=unclassified Streptomyces TaxID=2593676 RepID=UPI00344D4C45
MQVSPASGAASTGSRATDIESSVVDWLRNELDDQEITGDDNFLDIGGHSLTFARLNKHVGAAFGVVLDNRTTYSESLSVAVSKAQPAETH